MKKESPLFGVELESGLFCCGMIWQMLDKSEKDCDRRRIEGIGSEFGD